MKYFLYIRSGKGFTIKESLFEFTQHVRVNDIVLLDHYYAESFSEGTFAKCVERTFKMENKTEICVISLETAYKS